MRKKCRIFAVILCLMLAVSTLSACGTDESKDSVNICKDYAEKCLTAESMTVNTDDETMFKVVGNTMYWKLYTLSTYGEYYISPDSNGQKWIYYSGDDFDWTKMPISDDEYLDYYMYWRACFGFVEDTYEFLLMCYYTFDDSMLEVNGERYSMRDEVKSHYGIEEFEIWVVQNNFHISIDYNELVISDINETKIELPAELGDAKVGKVTIPIPHFDFDNI